MAPGTKWNRRLALAGGAALALAGGYFAFRRPPGSGFNLSRGDPRILHRGNSAEPSTLDPHKASTQWEDWIMGDMLVGLMHQDAKGDPMPAACESVRASADGLTFTVRLREHLWSDGVPVTADDYVFSFHRIADPKTAAQYVPILYPIVNMREAAEGKVPPDQVGVRALDPRTLEIKVQYQVPYMDQLLMHQTTYAVPKHVVEKVGDAWLRPENIVTNGPFVLKEWVPNDHIHLVKNPHFFDAANVALDHVYFYPTEDTPAALKRFRAGELDIVNRCPPTTDVALLKREIPGAIKIFPFTATYYLPFNVHRKPFDDVRVRLAVALAIDRETLADKVVRIGQIPAYNIVPPGMPHYSYAARMRFKPMAMAARFAKAKALLAEAGFGPDNPLTFDLTMYNSTDWKRWAIALQAMWAKAGIRAHLMPVDSQILYEMLRKKDFAVASAGWVADFRDPRNFLFVFQTENADLNYGAYSSAKYDALVAGSDFIHDPDARLKALADAEQVALDDVAVAPLLHDVTRDTVSPQVKGWIPNPTDFNRSRFLSLDRGVRSL
jgi:oligopeptide transport system substrate-binding protein